MPERIQETEIHISPKDKEIIISKIRNSKNFKQFENEKELANDKGTEQFGTTEEIFNFKYPEFYSIELYRKIDNSPIKFFISVYEKSNMIKYKKIED